MTRTYAGPMTEHRGGRWPPGTRFAVDVVLFARLAGDLAVLAVERAKEPFSAALALPGGFIQPGERPAAAAARELAEETGIAVAVGGLRRLALYGTPGRDPRGRVVSVAYHGVLPTTLPAVAGSDARATRWVNVAEFVGPRARAAFDHGEIVRDALRVRFG